MFWETFEKLCSSVGKAPSTVAEEIGLKSTGTVSGWKNGATPRKSVQNKLAEYFGVSVGYLMGYEQKEKPAPSEGNELNPDYANLTPENRAFIDSMIEKLLKSQSDD